MLRMQGSLRGERSCGRGRFGRHGAEVERVVVSRKDERDSGSASNPSKAPQIAQAIAPIVSVSPPMLAHMIAARSALRQ